MKFRNKILLSIYGVVVSLLLITFFIVIYWTQSRVEGTFANELRANIRTLSVLTALQSDQLIRSCQVIAESPRLRAIAELGDRRTAEQLAQEISQTSLADLLILTTKDGKILAQILNGHPRQWKADHSATIVSALHAQPATGAILVEGIPYRVVTSPLLVGDGILGTLTLGYIMHEKDLLVLRESTGSDIVLASDSTVLLSTARSEYQTSLEGGLGKAERSIAASQRYDEPIIHHFGGRTEEFLCAGIAIGGTTGPSSGALYYFAVKPVGAELSDAVSPVLGAFGLLSLLFVGLTTGLGIAIARGITRPINALVIGTAEIARGNYDYRIDVSGRDEMAALAQRFGEMSRSLKDKIEQLARVNEDVVARNADLDEALRQLRDAQEEIVRSERLAATGKLTAQLAHEINNPVHNIQSCLQTALTRLPADASGRELIDLARDEVARVSRLIRQMLDLFRTTVAADNFTSVDVNAALLDVLALVHVDLETRGITVKSRLQEGLPPVAGVRDKLVQVFLNIISNARDAMPSGGVLGMSTSADERHVNIVIDDTGFGIPRENMDRIFDAFFTTKSTVSGVGLGLSVCYGIVQQHRGTISVHSEIGVGTAFTISLPVMTVVHGENTNPEGGAA